MSGIAGIGIPALGCYISVITIIGGVPARTHLPAKEHHDPDDERAAHDERRRQCHQIGAHTGLLAGWTSFPNPPLGIVTHEAGRPATAPAISGPRDNGPPAEYRADRNRFQLCAYARAGCLRRAALHGRIGRRVPRRSACPLTVLPGLQQRL